MSQQASRCQTALPTCLAVCAALLDLHYFSATGAVVVLRAWLLLLKLAALEGRRVEPGTTLGIVTGELQGPPVWSAGCLGVVWHILALSCRVFLANLIVPCASLGHRKGHLLGDL